MPPECLAGLDSAEHEAAEHPVLLVPQPAELPHSGAVPESPGPGEGAPVAARPPEAGHGQLEVLDTARAGADLLPLRQPPVLQRLPRHADDDEVRHAAWPQVLTPGDLLGVVVVLLGGDLLHVLAVPLLHQVQEPADPGPALDHRVAPGLAPGVGRSPVGRLQQSLDLVPGQLLPRQILGEHGPPGPDQAEGRLRGGNRGVCMKLLP